MQHEKICVFNSAAIASQGCTMIPSSQSLPFPSSRLEPKRRKKTTPENAHRACVTRLSYPHALLARLPPSINTSEGQRERERERERESGDGGERGRELELKKKKETEVEPEDSPNWEEEGQTTRQRKRPDFLIVENFEFGDVDYCCPLRTIPAHYSEAVNSVNSNNWILPMRGEFDSLVENSTFEWQKAPKNKTIIGCRCFFTNKSHEYKALRVTKRYSQIYGKDYRKNFQQIWLP